MSFDWKKYEIPELFQNELYEVFDEKKSFVEKAVKLLYSPKPWCLYFFGQPGVGKSLFAVNLFKHFLEKPLGHSGIFLTCHSYFLKIQETMDSNFRQVDLLRNFFEIDILILDDFGYIRATEWQIEKISMLLENRFNNVKKTLITSNLCPKDVWEQWGPRLHRRICEVGQPFEMTESQYHKNALERKNLTERYVHTDH